MGILIAYCKKCKSLLGSEMNTNKVDLVGGIFNVPCTCGSNAVVPHGIYDFQNNIFDVFPDDNIPKAILDQIRIKVKLENNKKNENVPVITDKKTSNSDSNSFKDLGRNDFCSCGSGIKYKKCHGK